MNTTLTQPPFPHLTWDETYWVGTVCLPTWAGFRVPSDPWGAVDRDRTSDGTARLIVEGPDDSPLPPSDAQAVAFQYLIDHEEIMRDQVLQTIFDYYQENQEGYGYPPDVAAEKMPDIEHLDDLKNLIGLSTVHLLEASDGGSGYLGFEFGCTWDEDHGLGVMTRDGHILVIGDAEVAFTEGDADEAESAIGLPT